MGSEIVALAGDLKVPVFDMYAFMKVADADGHAKDPGFLTFNTPGDCHPNELGHKLMGRALADFLLGRSTIQHTPFQWKYIGQPEANAVFADNPTDASLVAGLKPMLLDQQNQMGDPDRWKGPKDLSAKAYAAWDETALHLTVDIADDVVLAGDKQPAWDFDGIEFFFDTRPREQRDVAYAPEYFQMLVSVPKEDGPSVVTCGNMDTLDAADGGYRIHLTIPWAQLRLTPKAGENWDLISPSMTEIAPVNLATRRSGAAPGTTTPTRGALGRCGSRSGKTDCRNIATPKTHNRRGPSFQ